MPSPWKTGFKRILFFLPFLSVSTDAMGPVLQTVQIPFKAQPKGSIPYPGGSFYLSRGIYSTLAGGLSRNYGDSASLYQWQGEMGFFYTPRFSGGMGFKMIAGQPSDPIQKIKNRFFVFGRFHKIWSEVAAYAGLQIGVEDLNISLTPLDSGDFEEPLSKINAGMVLESGLGWKFSRYVGFTLGQNFDASFVGDASLAGADSARAERELNLRHLEGALNFRTLPGIAVDVLALAPSMRKKVKAMNVFVETQIGYLVLQNKTQRRDFAWISGVVLAF